MTEPLSYRRDARAPATLILAGGTIALAGFVWAAFDAAWWIALPVALIAIPALVEAAQGRVATLTLDDTRLTWHSGKRHGDVALGRIQLARFRTTLDMSQRLTLDLHDAARARVPAECLPPGRILEDALRDKGIGIKRTILFD